MKTVERSSVKAGLARPCSLKKGFHKAGSLDPRCGPSCLVSSFGGTYESGGPGAVNVVGGGKFGGPARGEKNEGTGAPAEGRGGTVGTLGGSSNTFLGIDPSALAGTTPECWKMVKR